MSKPFKIIDIGHSGFTIDEAIAELETTVSDYIFYGNTRALKIIHGHGSGTLKKAVREWCISQEGRFQAVIYGEDYDLFEILPVIGVLDLCKVLEHKNITNVPML